MSDIQFPKLKKPSSNVFQATILETQPVTTKPKKQPRKKAELTLSKPIILESNNEPLFKTVNHEDDDEHQENHEEQQKPLEQQPSQLPKQIPQNYSSPYQTNYNQYQQPYPQYQPNPQQQPQPPQPMQQQQQAMYTNPYMGMGIPIYIPN